MTVALIRDRGGADAVEVAFSESARFYRLLPKNPKFDTILGLLREAKEKNRPVRVLVDFPEGDVIQDAQADREG
jgi:hypothetical protein